MAKSPCGRPIIPCHWAKRDSWPKILAAARQSAANSWKMEKCRLSAESRYAEGKGTRGSRTRLGEDESNWGALRTPHSALERLFSGIHFGMDDWGSARVPRAGSGVAPEPLVERFSLGNGFRRDAENGNRDGRAPRYGRVARSAIRNSQFVMVRASFPVFILGWTIGGSARVPRAGSGVAPEPLVERFSLGDGFSARRRKRQPGRARSPAKSQPGGQWQFGVDERGNGRGAENPKGISLFSPALTVRAGSARSGYAGW